MKQPPDPARAARTAIEARAASCGERRQRFLQWVCERIDLDRFAAMQSEHLAAPKSAGTMIKYLDLAYYLDGNFGKALKLRLHKRPPRRILDLGCGPGHFLLACDYFGHEAIGIDPADNPIVSDMTHLFGVKTVRYRIAPMQRLPDLGRFHLITAHNANWYRIDEDRVFGAAEWRFILDDLIDRHLEPGGRLALSMNHYPECTGLAPGVPKFARLIERFDGVVDVQRRAIHIPSP